MTTEQVEAEILKLPERDRARLAQRLLASLDADREREEKWYDEAERRLAQLEFGEAAVHLLQEHLGMLIRHFK